MDSALLSQIQKGKGLRKAQTNDRSQAQGVGAVLDGSTPKPAAPRAPPVPGGGGGGGASSAADDSPAAGGGGPPQLAGIFAGLPRLPLAPRPLHPPLLRVLLPHRRVVLPLRHLARRPLLPLVLRQLLLLAPHQPHLLRPLPPPRRALLPPPHLARRPPRRRQAAARRLPPRLRLPHLHP
ncbi:uncharacterized protein JCM10292_002392, partial [Rhodotorula paludigena]|uniref:uncharacterized protein n=1 Tax=Rhodotorula paludigena TaxID=86838 RepID=UPI0031705F32